MITRHNMNCPSVVEFPRQLLIVVGPLLALLGTGASGDTSEAVRNEYNSILDEIRFTLSLPEFEALADANLMFEKMNLDRAGSRLGELVLDPMMARQQDDGAYAALYERHIMRPCKKIIRLDAKLNDFLDRHPELSSDVFDGSLFILGDLPVLYEDIVEICQREYVRKRDQGQREYEAILGEIDQLIDDTDEGVLAEAVRLLDLHSQQSTDFGEQQTSLETTSKAVAELLLGVRKIRRVGESSALREFNSVFESYVAQPCARTIELATKLDDCLKRYPQIDDTEHRCGLLPDYFHVVARICAQIKRDGSWLIFNEFQKLKALQ